MYHLKSFLYLAITLVLSNLPLSEALEIEFKLQRRDPAGGNVIITPAKIDPAKLGVVVIDSWNWHWCKTTGARVNSFVPRMNLCLREMRKAGATVFVCPTDVVDAYVGTPQRERAMSVEILPLPEPKHSPFPKPPIGPGCACLVRCGHNYGWNAMNPDFIMDDNDLMPNSRETLYALAKKRGITHLIYMGVHTQVCLLGKDLGLRNMLALGFECILARDLTDSYPDYDPARDVYPDDLTAKTLAHFEKHLCATVNMKEALEHNGLWRHQGPVDPVRAAPWGTVKRPHIFDISTLVNLSTPFQPDAEIRYTT